MPKPYHCSAHLESALELAAGMPSENLTPFYLLSSLVIDAAHQDWDVLQKLNSDTTDLDAPPSVS